MRAVERRWAGSVASLGEEDIPWASTFSRDDGVTDQTSPGVTTRRAITVGVATPVTKAGVAVVRPAAGSSPLDGESHAVAEGLFMSFTLRRLGADAWNGLSAVAIPHISLNDGLRPVQRSKMGAPVTPIVSCPT